jgi:hypothetical protein
VTEINKRYTVLKQDGIPHVQPLLIIFNSDGFFDSRICIEILPGRRILPFAQGKGFNGSRHSKRKHAENQW